MAAKKPRHGSETLFGDLAENWRDPICLPALPSVFTEFIRYRGVFTGHEQAYSGRPLPGSVWRGAQTTETWLPRANRVNKDAPPDWRLTLGRTLLVVFYERICQRCVIGCRWPVTFVLEVEMVEDP